MAAGVENAFDRDVERFGSYLYTRDDRLSTRLATGRGLKMVAETGEFAGRTVVDIGCGDGHLSVKLFDAARPASVTGVDVAERAVEAARERAGDRPMTFRVGSAYDLPLEADCADVALFLGVLHHLDEPARAIREGFRVAPTVVIYEPNGYNPGLKVIEKASSYHREHEERSYPAARLRAWLQGAGGEVVHERFGGFVPMFAPDLLARAMKLAEPVVERTPLRKVGCAVYLAVARRPASSASS
jgi:SAM-dependent methyltransferase